MIAARAENLQTQKPQDSGHDDFLRRRFKAFVDRNGSIGNVARKLNRSVETVSQYLEERPIKNLTEFQNEVLALLCRKEDERFSPSRGKCCITSVVNAINECASFAYKHLVMVLILAASGFGKTIALTELAKDNDNILYTVLDVSTRAPGMILKSICISSGGVPRGYSTSELLHTLGERLKGQYRLLLIDDVHFANWQSFEMLRYLHDSSGIGILLAGQPRTYDVMMGRADKAMLYDQLVSRLAMRRNIKSITRKDVELVVDSVVGGLDKACLDFLFQRASGQGRLRTLNNILRIASEAADELGSPITLEILKEAEQYLVF